MKKITFGGRSGPSPRHAHGKNGTRWMFAVRTGLFCGGYWQPAFQAEPHPCQLNDIQFTVPKTFQAAKHDLSRHIFNARSLTSFSVAAENAAEKCLSDYFKWLKGAKMKADTKETTAYALISPGGEIQLHWIFKDEYTAKRLVTKGYRVAKVRIVEQEATK